MGQIHDVKISYSLIIKHTDTITATDGTASTKTNSYLVTPVDGVTLTRGIDCIPSKLEFSVIKDGVLSFTEGDPVTLQVGDDVVFRGRIFEKQRESTRDELKVIAYDQIIYLTKNSDCYVYYDKTATEVLNMICDDYQLTKGTFANTAYKIGTATQQRIEDNKTLADIIMYAVDTTFRCTVGHYYYHIYDDAGKIMLSAQSAMKLDILIDQDSMSDYAYTSSIDKDTYTAVKIVRKAPSDNSNNSVLVKTGFAVDQDNVKQWGYLQYVLRPDDQDTRAVDQALAILAVHDSKTREIKLKGVLGDIRVRGGSLVFIKLNLGDIILNGFLMVTHVVHHFNENYHSMDLDVYYPEPAGKYEVTYNNEAAVLAKIADAKKKNNVSSNGQLSGDASSSLVQAGFSAANGRVSQYGSDGCVETALYAGSYYNTDLAALYTAGVADVDVLCSRMSGLGYQIDDFNGYANPGDILIYGSRQHVTIADGAGGCFGNSSSLGYAKYYDNCTDAFATGSAPTEIIRLSKV